MHNFAEAELQLKLDDTENRVRRNINITLPKNSEISLIVHFQFLTKAKVKTAHGALFLLF